MRIALSLLCAFLLQISLNAQNSDCNTPSGPSQQPDSLQPVCYPGYSGTNTGALNQCYTFVATWSKMRFSMSAAVDTDINCAFPNTSIQYANFEFYESTDCVNLLTTTPIFDNLVVGDTYTFCLSITPVDPVCNWVSQTCPRVLEMRDLPVEESALRKADLGTHYQLSWESYHQETGVQYQLERMNAPEGTHKVLARFPAKAAQSVPGRYQFDQRPPTGKSWIVGLSRIEADGSISYLDAVELKPKSTPGFWSINPNPCSAKVNLDYSGPESRHCRLAVYNAAGAAILKVAGSPDAIRNVLNQNLSNFEPGIYITEITNEHQRWVSKLMKR